jgi:two-component system sensor histidine kinase/response regulator
MMQTKALANVLVVDDTADNLRLLTGLLEQLDYEVRPATSGRQALQAAEHDPPDLVLLDVSMPEMDGYEVCRRLKASPLLKDIPVIFLTALSDIANKVEAFEVGGVDYITKPFHLAEVQARVKTQLGLRAASLELTRSYAKLKKLEKLRDDLVHMVVHDMRSPLAVLSGHLGFLQEERDRLSPEGANDLDAAIQSARGLARMANDLLDASRLEEDKLPLSLAEHDLVVLAAAVKESLTSLTRERAIELAAAPPTSLVCDGGLVQRILENLVTNAIKHTPAGTAIHIAVSRQGERARVTVSDEGPGVPLEARLKIFEKFGVLAARKQDSYHSAGVGLAFCKLAVEAHGGTIGVEPAEPTGSIFWFELPLTQAAGP